MDDGNKKEIILEIKKLKSQLNQFDNNQKDNDIINKDQILYRLIYLNKKLDDEDEMLKYIKICLDSNYFLSEDIWLDYLNIMKTIKSNSTDIIIKIFLRALNDFQYEKIIYDFFQYLFDVSNEVNVFKKNSNYFIKYLCIGIYFPDYSLRIFNLFYKFHFKLLKSDNKIKDNFDEQIKNILLEKCDLSKLEVKQIFHKYKSIKNDNFKEVFFIFKDKKIIDDEDIFENLNNKMMDFHEQFNTLLKESFDKNDLLKELIEENNDLLLKVNKNYLLSYINKILSVYIDDSSLWTKYISLIEKDKLNIIKTANNCCKKEGIFIIDYLYEFEKNNNIQETEKLIEQFLNDPSNKKKIEDIYIYYLQFKIRNFEKSKKNTEIIRKIFQKCLTNIENYDIKEFTTKILHMWAEFEVYKTKDKDLFYSLMSKICTNLDKSLNSFRAFIYYAKSFENNENQIRNIYQMAYENLPNEEKILITNNWLQWEYLFGNINSINNVKKMIQQQNSKINNNFSEIIDNEKNCDDDKKVFIKGINSNIKETELIEFIKEKCPLIQYKNLRLVFNDNGTNRGYAFIDFNTSNDAQLFINQMNNNISNNNIGELICALCLSPKSGKNDKRTLFINNLPFDVTKENIKNLFEKFGNILDIRIIYNPTTQKPRGYAYVEFQDESVIDKIINCDKNFIINGRKIIVNKSVSVDKLRNAIKYVVHISNLNFKIKENDIKIFLKEKIFDDDEKKYNESVKKILLCKDDDGKFKGYGFIEFNDKESFDKCLKLDELVFKGRNLVIKESNRNITEKKLGNKESENNSIIDENFEEKKFLNKKRKNDNKGEIKEVKNDKKEVEETKEENSKKKKRMKNSEFKKLFD